MYHAIVRSNVRKLFDALGRGDLDYAVAGMATHFEHIFPGDHTLGGVRHTRPGIRAWLERLLRVLPGLLVIDAMRVMAAAGVSEALAPKIED